MNLSVMIWKGRSSKAALMVLAGPLAVDEAGAAPGPPTAEEISTAPGPPTDSSDGAGVAVSSDGTEAPVVEPSAGLMRSGRSSRSVATT